MFDWSDQRRSLRAPVKCPSSVRLENGRWFRGQTVDLSQGGASMLLDEPLKQGTICLISIEIPANLGIQGVIEAVAEVRYHVLVAKGPCRLGLMFLQMREGSQTLLERVIARVSPVGNIV